MKTKAKQFALALASFALVSLSAHAADTYKVDPVHSSVNFKVRHFFNLVTGSFPKFTAEIQFDADKPQDNKATATIEIASINTHNDDRNAHLRSADFFDVAKFPTLTYESTQWTKTGEKTYDVTGNLTFLGITKPVTLEVEYLGSGEGLGNKKGLTVIGLAAKGKVNRSDWGLNGAAPVVGDEVLIEISVQAQK